MVVMSKKKGKPLSKSIEAGEPCNLFSGRVKLCSREHNTTTAFAMPLFSHPIRAWRGGYFA
jgi:hypothetical protein